MRNFVRVVLLAALIVVSGGADGGVLAQAEDPPWVDGNPVCPGALPTVLRAGMTAMVTPGDPNTLRSDPSLNAAAVGSIPGGAQFTVLEGVKCADGYAWLHVDYAGVQGWTAQGTDSVYWLVPVEQPAAAAPTVGECVESRLYPGAIVRVIADEPLRIRDKASTSGEQIGQVSHGQILALLEVQTVCRDGHMWWRVRNILSDSNMGGLPLDGYISEGYGGEYWLEPVYPPAITSIPLARAAITPANARDVTLLMELELSSTEVLNALALELDANGVPWLAVGTENGSIYLGNLVDMQFTWLERAHADAITVLAFDEGAVHLASGDVTGNVQVRAVAEPIMPRFSWRFDAEARVNDLSFRRGEQLGAVAGNEAIVWDLLLVDQLIHLHYSENSRFESIALNQRGDQVVLGNWTTDRYSPDDKDKRTAYGTVIVWDMLANQAVFEQPTAWVTPPSSYVHFVGQVMYSSEWQRIISVTNVGVLEQWSVTTHEALTAPLSTKADWLQFSQDETWIATTTANGAVFLRDSRIETVYAQLINTVFSNSRGFVPEHALALSADDTLLVSLGSSRSVLIWGLPAQ